MRKTLAVLLLACATGASAMEARPELLCGGVEPFWSLEIGAETALFATPDGPDLSYSIPDERAAEGRFWPRALTLLAPQDTAIAIVRPASCSDTMSDRAYDWNLDLLTQRGGEAIIYTGCCREAPE